MFPVLFTIAATVTAVLTLLDVLIEETNQGITDRIMATCSKRITRLKRKKVKSA
jgi:hypothetical protein